MLPDIRRRIVGAKYVLERAARIQAESNEMSLSISLLLMHDAVELLMLAVLDHLNLAAKKRREFMDFWSEIEQGGHAVPPDFIPMESLNKLRVGLKHSGNLPHPQTVRDLLPRAVGFFENVLSAYCGLRYSDISLIDLVPDKDVCSLLHEAEKEFSSGKKADALTNLRLALHKVERPEGKPLPLLQAPDAPRLPMEIARAEWVTYLRDLDSFLKTSALRSNAEMFGFDPDRYAFFIKNTPNIQWSVSGKQTVMHLSRYSAVSERDFADMIDFLIDYALKVSEAYP
jgi:hypothetical protein